MEALKFDTGLDEEDILIQVQMAYDKVSLARTAGIAQIEWLISEYLLARARMIEHGLIVPRDRSQSPRSC